MPRKLTLPVAGAAFLAALAWRFLTFNGFTNDHYVFLALAQQVLLGEWPLRDFVDPGEPLTYLVSATAWRFWGDTLAVEWTISAAAFAGGAALTLLVGSRLAGSIAIGALVTALEILISPRSYGYPKVLLYALAGYAILRFTRAPTRRHVYLLGGVAAIAFLFRHDHGVYIGCGGAVAMIAASPWAGVRVTSRRLGTFLATGAVCLVPWLAYVTFNGGLPAYLRIGMEFSRAETTATALRTWPRFERQPGQPLLGLRLPSRPLGEVKWTSQTSDSERAALERRFGLQHVRDGEGTRFYYVHDTTEANIRALADDVHVEDTNGLGRVQRPLWREAAAALSPFRIAPALHSRRNAESWLYYLFWMLPLACGISAIVTMRRGTERWPGEGAAVLAIAVMALGANLGFLRDVLAVRLPDAATPAALLGAWALGRSVPRRTPARVMLAIGAVIVATATTAAVGDVAQLNEQFGRTALGEGWQEIGARVERVKQWLALSPREAPPSRVTAALLPFFRYLDRCTTDSDRLVLVGLLPDVPVLARRGFGGKALALVHGYSPQGSQDRTIEALTRQSAPLLLLPSEEYQEFQLVFPLIDAFVSREYDVMGEVAIQGDEGESVRILVRRDRIGTAIDPETQWPCLR